MNILIPTPPCKDNFKLISPGLVGPVGDVNMATRMRTSNADMFPVMFSKSAANLPRMGTDIQDGDTLAQVNGGGYPATCLAYKWNVKQSTKTDVGDRWQDMRQNSRYVEPVVVGSNQYDFKNLVAQVEQAKVTGNQFLPLPNGYALGELSETPRGGLVPSIVLSTASEGQDQQQRDKFGQLLAPLLMAPPTRAGDSAVKPPIRTAPETIQLKSPPVSRRPSLLSPSPTSSRGTNMSA